VVLVWTLLKYKESCGVFFIWRSQYVGCNLQNMKAPVLFIFMMALTARVWGQTNNPSVSTLITPSFKITIEVRCPEGEVECDDVKYIGISQKTSHSITLIGKEIHAIGADGVTPGHFLGYEFKNGKTTYFVNEDGELTVTRESKVLVDEHGIWKW
jgi:hypothetical protein